MQRQAAIYHFYKSTPLRILRVITAFSLVILSFGSIGAEALPKFPLIFLSLFLMHEIFFRFHVASYQPKTTVAQNDGSNMLDSFTLYAAEILVASKTTSSILHLLLENKSIIFILKKANIDVKEVQKIEIAKDILGKEAFEIAKGMEGGKFVTSMDLFAAYIILTEPQTKLLFNKKLKEEEFLHIVYWACVDFPKEENPKPIRVDFWGEGIGESWVSGWTIETKKYTQDLTAQILATPSVNVGRENEYKQLIEALSKREENNALIIGEAGSGKDNLVMYFGSQSFAGNVPSGLLHRRIFRLMVGPLIAGTEGRSDLEARIQAIIEELSHAKNIVLYIPDFENIINMSFGVDLSSALTPYLSSGKIPLIAAITPGAYKQFVEDSPIREVFATIRLEEPDRDIAIKMVLENVRSVELKEKVVITYKAIVASVDLARKYIRDRSLPGSALLLLSDSAHSVSLSRKKIVEEDDVIRKIEERVHVAVAAPKDEEKTILLNLETKLHERVVDQREAIAVIAEAVRRIRVGLGSDTKPISFLFLGPTGVGKTETAKALAAAYFGGEDKMIRFDMSEYADVGSVNRLLGAKPGEGDERGELTDKIYDHPFSLVLLDEFEKAHFSIVDLFLQVLEDGRLTDNKGRTVSFANSIIIATSNAGSEFIREEVEKGAILDKRFHQQLISLLQIKGIFKPELLNRFDDIVTFKPLGSEELVAITGLLLAELVRKLDKKDISVAFDDTVLEKIAREGFDQQFGARPLRRYIQDNIEDLLSQKMLLGEITRGSNVLLSIDSAGSISTTISSASNFVQKAY